MKKIQSGQPSILGTPSLTPEDAKTLPRQTKVTIGTSALLGRRDADAWSRDAGRLAAAHLRTRDSATRELDGLVASVAQRLAASRPRVTNTVPGSLVGAPLTAGVAVGELVADPDHAQRLAERGQPFVFVLRTLQPAAVDAALAASALVVVAGPDDALRRFGASLGKPAIAVSNKASVGLAVGKEATVDGTVGRLLPGAQRATAKPLDAAFTADVDALRAQYGATVTAEATTAASVREAKQLGADKLRVDADAFLSTQPTVGYLRQYLLATEAAPRRALLEKLLVSVRTQAEALIAEAGSMGLDFALGTRQPHSYFPVRPELLDQVAGELGLPAKLVRDRVGELGSGNSKLGLRGARWSIKDPELFAALGRGIMEAHASATENGQAPGALSLLMPSVSLGAEMQQVRARLEDVREKVEDDFGVAVPTRYGAGIETAAGALSARDISAHADYLEYGLEEMAESLFGISRDDAKTFLPQMVEQGIYPADPFKVVDMDGLGKMVLVGQGLAGERANAFPASVRGNLAASSDGLLAAKRGGIDEIVVPASMALAARVEHATVTQALRTVRGVQLAEPELRDTRAKALDVLTRSTKVEDQGTFKPDAIPEGVTPLEFLGGKLRALKAGAVDEKQLLLSIPTTIVDQLRRPTIPSGAKLNELAKGIPASAGSGVGRVALSAEKAAEYQAAKVPYVLIVNEVHAEEVPAVRKGQALISVRGGKTSHAAMIAANSDVPCVMNEKVAINLETRTVKVGRGSVKEGDWITVDGTKGLIAAGQVELVDPSNSPEFSQLMQLANKHRKMKVIANADTPDEVVSAMKRGAEGVGLVRTEHMFFEPARLAAFRSVVLGDPDRSAEELLLLEQMQYEDFKAMIDAAGDKKLSIRLLDPPLHEFLPHDPEGISAMAKLLDLTPAEVARRVDKAQEVDSLLGLRGVRLAVARPDIEAMQVRALARAYVDAVNEGQSPAPLHITIPMLNTGDEMKAAKDRVLAAVDEVAAKANLEIPIKLGAMIETPRAALDAHEIAEHCDFFSFGTNDLTQLTLGYGRNVATKFIPELVASGALDSDPTGTLDRRTVARMMQVATFLGKDTSGALETGICGGQGADPESVRICQAVGLDYLSVPPSSIAKAQLGAAQAGVLAEQSVSAALDATRPAPATQKLLALAMRARRALDGLGAPPWSVATDLQREHLQLLYRELNRDLRDARRDGDPKTLLALVPAFEARSAVRGALDAHRMLATLGGELTRLESQQKTQLPADARVSLGAAREAYDELVALSASAAGQPTTSKGEGVLAAKYRDVMRALDAAVLKLDAAYPLTDKTLRERVRHRNDYWQNQWYTRTPPQKGEPMGAWIKSAAQRFLADNDLSIMLVGQENIPKDRPVIYAAAHRSGAIDRFVMGAALPFDDDKMLYQVREGSPLDVQAQKTYGPDNPWIVTGAKTPATEAVGASTSTFQRVLDKVRRGFASGARTLITYPEGTGTLTGEARYPAMGTVLMAAATGAVIVPVLSHDSFEVRPLEGGEVSVRAMPPIDVGALGKTLGSEVGEQEVLQLAHALLEFDLGGTYRSQA